MADVVTIKEAVQRAKADGLPVTEYTLRHWLKSGTIPTRKIGKKVLLFYPNLVKYLQCDDSRRADILHGYKTAQILYIDDLFKTGRAADGSCNPTQADVRLAYEIIDYRYRCNLPTIISTERTPLGLLEIDQATGGRIKEMAGKNLFTIDTDMKRNYRLRDTVMV